MGRNQNGLSFCCSWEPKHKTEIEFSYTFSLLAKIWSYCSAISPNWAQLGFPGLSQIPRYCVGPWIPWAFKARAGLPSFSSFSHGGWVAWGAPESSRSFPLPLLLGVTVTLRRSYHSLIFEISTLSRWLLYNQSFCSLGGVSYFLGNIFPGEHCSNFIIRTTWVIRVNRQNFAFQILLPPLQSIWSDVIGRNVFEAAASSGIQIPLNLY